MVDEYELGIERRGDFHQQAAQLFGFRLVEAGPRLVHENDLGPADQRLGDLNHAALEQIELAAKHVAALAQPDEVEGNRNLAPSAGVIGRDMIGDRLDVFHAQ